MSQSKIAAKQPQDRCRSESARLLVNLVLRPWYWRFLLRGVVAALEHEPLLQRQFCRTVIDSGASRGQFALVAQRCLPYARIVAFQPIGAACNALRRAFSGDAGFRAYSLALGSRPGHGLLHRSRHEPSSSLLRIGPIQTRLFPGTDEVGGQTVEVRRLDQVLDEQDLARPVLCKIDVQGTEEQVIGGFGQLVHLIDILLVEASFVEFYPGQVLFLDLASCLGERGFRLDRIYGGYRDQDDVILRCNCLFRQRSQARNDRTTPEPHCRTVGRRVLVSARPPGTRE